MRVFFFFSLNASNHRHNYLRCSEVLTRAYRSLSAWFSLPPRRLVIAVGRLSFPVVAEQVASGETRLSLEFPRFLSFFFGATRTKSLGWKFSLLPSCFGPSFFCLVYPPRSGRGRRLVVFFCRSIRLCA